jgi:hypothetical protein
MPSVQQARVFVSHHHSPDEDRITMRLVADLDAAGADVWVDVQGATSNSFVQKSSEGLEGRDWLVLVMTPESVASERVREEVNTAINEVKARRMLGVIPIVMAPTPDEAMPALWRHWTRYDATEDYEAARDKLLHALDLTLPVPAQPAPNITAPAPSSPQTSISTSPSSAPNLESAAPGQEPPPQSAPAPPDRPPVPDVSLPSPSPSALSENALAQFVNAVSATRHFSLRWLLIPAAILLAVGIIAIGAYHAPGLFAVADTSGPDAAATASAIAFQRAFFATSTAQLTQDYRPAGVGPCDTVDPPYPAKHSYWEWSQGTVYCVGAGIAEMRASGYIRFFGLPAGFPLAYQASYTLTFHPAAATLSCVNLSIGNSRAGSGVAVALCDDGLWKAGPTSYGYLLSATQYHVILTVGPHSASIAINGAQVIPSTPTVGETYVLGIGGLLATGATLDVSSFILHPSLA